MANEDFVFNERYTALRRMCIFSAVMFFLSVMSSAVGIAAIQTSDAKFPFNAGGALLVGLMDMQYIDPVFMPGFMHWSFFSILLFGANRVAQEALLFSICPMCMFCGVADKSPEPFDSGCCCMTLFLWGFLLLLGIPFGIGVNGVFALHECLHPSEKTGCDKNSSTKLTLSILTIILSIALLVLTILVYVTCLRHICKEIKDPHTYDVPSRRRRNNARSSRAQQEERINVYRTSSNFHVPRMQNSRNMSSYNGFIIEPTAPPVYWGDVNVRNNEVEDQNSRSNSGLSTEEIRHPDQEVRYPRRYEEPPPSYFEVMEKDDMETPL